MSHVVKCSRCGKQVSNPAGVEMIVRAFVECPECIERQPDYHEACKLVKGICEKTDPHEADVEVLRKAMTLIYGSVTQCLR